MVMNPTVLNLGESSAPIEFPLFLVPLLARKYEVAGN
jgi:hypothetical protein